MWAGKLLNHACINFQTSFGLARIKNKLADLEIPSQLRVEITIRLIQSASTDLKVKIYNKILNLLNDSWTEGFALGSTETS